MAIHCGLNDAPNPRYKGMEDTLIEILRGRRSVREFQRRPVEKETLDVLIEAVLRSPSSRGLNPWEFVVVTEHDTLEKLSQSKPHGADFLSDAPLAIVVCADPKKCDVWIEDCSIASTLIHLTAESLGLGSCWCQIRKRKHSKTLRSEEWIRSVLKIPSRYHVLSSTGIGYPAQREDGHPKESLEYGKIHREEW
jgi:nitroreductase